MKHTIIKAGIGLLLGSSLMLSGAEPIKLYGVKSGKIEYRIKGSGNIMGQTIQTIGKKRVIFDAYGAKNLTEESKVEKQVVMGQKKITKTHTIVYMNEGALYKADFDQKRIVRMENMGIAMAGMMGGGKNMQQSGEKMMKQMGGKKIGTDKVLGYTCDVWELMGTKQCIYKGITLKLEANIMGIKNTEVATKAEFDISLSQEDFKLPDFPLYDMYGNSIDKTKLSAMDSASQSEMLEANKALAELKNVMESAAKEAGIQQGKEPTKAQEQAMIDLMSSAMLPRMKQEILSDEKRMRIGYECLSKANTLKEANDCNDELNTMGEEEEPFEEWSSETKKETLHFMEKFLNEMVPCVKKAQTLQAVRECMPNE